LGTIAAHTDAVVQDMDATAYDALEDAEKGGTVDADGLVAATIQANDGKYYLNSADSKYYKIVYTAAAAELTYYFKDATDAAAALEAYNEWKADEDDEDLIAAKNTALAKGTTTYGGGVTVPAHTAEKSDTKTIELLGPAINTLQGPSNGSYKANKTYTITLSLAGMESITGGNDNINIGGYEVDEEGGGDVNIDMDEQPSVNP
jgi:beta-xylosidase